MSTGTQPLFQIFVWTASRSSRAPSAPVDTGFFAQNDSIIRGPTVTRSQRPYEYRARLTELGTF